MLPKHIWDNIAQENYFSIVGPERTDILSQENWLFQICLVAWLKKDNILQVIFLI